MTPRLSPERVAAIMEADDAIRWAQITSHMEIQRMKKHSLDYIDLHPKPVEQDEPSDLLIWGGAAVAVVAGLAGLVILLGWPL